MKFDDVFKSRIRSDWAEVLRGILAQARKLGSQAVLAFDLDSTLFDSRPRQARILREYGQTKALAPLLSCLPEHFSSSWDMRGALLGCGLPAQEADRLFPEVRAFWRERFFTSDYCAEDSAIEGAAAFTHAVATSGALLCYVTGRHEGMRRGSEEAMRRCHLALPGGNVHLLMKPAATLDDDTFKRQAHATLGSLGRLIAAFDNEPTHVNDYRARFPEATVIHLATDHSGRPVELVEGVVSVPHFGIDL